MDDLSSDLLEIKSEQINKKFPESLRALSLHLHTHSSAHSLSTYIHTAPRALSTYTRTAPRALSPPTYAQLRVLSLHLHTHSSARSLSTYIRIALRALSLSLSTNIRTAENVYLQLDHSLKSKTKVIVENILPLPSSIFFFRLMWAFFHVKISFFVDVINFLKWFYISSVVIFWVQFSVSVR